MSASAANQRGGALRSATAAVALCVGLAACTSVDETFGLADTNASVVATGVPKADVGDAAAIVASAADRSKEAPAVETAEAGPDEPADAEATLAATAPADEAQTVAAGDAPTSADGAAVADASTSVASASGATAVPVPPAALGAATEAAAPVLALREVPKRKSLFSFLSEPKAKARASRTRDAKPRRSRERSFAALSTAKAGVRSAPRASRRRVAVIEPRRGGLPGVRSKASIFGIGRGENEDGAFRVASAGGFARGAGAFLKQTSKVETACFKPDLVAALQTVERHFGAPVIVTSGYRSPRRNRRAGGAKGSKHMSCEAADIQIPGVSKGKLAAFLRSMPGRGGVGTYCHTKSVHYDVGKQRDWSWGCRRR